MGTTTRRADFLLLPAVLIGMLAGQAAGQGGDVSYPFHCHTIGY
ncbi:MAG TPA: hypothetical protein PK668_26535 [Myxococcota bacterium]|nr:hypothetical protein [Myxococcota bacterium]HRY97086.1 hypothetical protein [Myxococcota bacterium]HSA21126.1 hypothetical protein [Myxococcota bacterium]